MWIQSNITLTRLPCFQIFCFCRYRICKHTGTTACAVEESEPIRLEPSEYPVLTNESNMASRYIITLMLTRRRRAMGIFKNFVKTLGDDPSQETCTGFRIKFPTIRTVQIFGSFCEEERRNMCS